MSKSTAPDLHHGGVTASYMVHYMLGLARDHARTFRAARSADCGAAARRAKATFKRGERRHARHSPLPTD